MTRSEHGLRHGSAGQSFAWRSLMICLPWPIVGAVRPVILISTSPYKTSSWARRPAVKALSPIPATARAWLLIALRSAA